MTERAAIFGTAHIDSDPSRYVDWATYYTDFFADTDTDILIINDGPAVSRPNLCGIEVIELAPYLGRKAHLCSPGFKRSFAHGLRVIKERGYRWIGYLETDCYILPNGREEYLWHLHNAAHAMSWCRTYGFPEPSLQVINAIPTIDTILSWYDGPSGWFAHEEFEKRMGTLGAGKIMEGDRHEGVNSRVHAGDTYVAQVTLSTIKQHMPHLLVV